MSPHNRDWRLLLVCLLFEQVRGVRWLRSDGEETSKGDVAPFGGDDKYAYVEYTFQQGEVVESLLMSGSGYGYGSFQNMTLDTIRGDGIARGHLDVGYYRAGSDWTPLIKGV